MIIMVVGRFDGFLVLNRDDDIRGQYSADYNNRYIMMITIVRNIRIFTILMIHYNQFRNEVIVLQKTEL